ncbi:MAG: hypothetical protein IJJ64_15080, partial [Butyrivibrio sp.]|nr:hypothetical protein [Butyrivibrio sp.]
VECQTNFWFELGHSILPDLFLVWLFFCIFPVVFSRFWGYNQEKCMDFWVYEISPQNSPLQE